MKANGRHPWANRISGYGAEAPDQLLANPLNFRIHPTPQQEALAGSLDTLGWIQQVVVNRQTGNMIDGHLRVQMALRNGEPSVPVLYVDLTEAEEKQALLMLDPIAAMAATDKDKLDELLRQVQSDDERVTAMLAGMAEREKVIYAPSDLTPQFSDRNYTDGDFSEDIKTIPDQLEKNRVQVICPHCGERFYYDSDRNSKY